MEQEKIKKANFNQKQIFNAMKQRFEAMDTDVFSEGISKEFTVKEAKVAKERKTLFK